MKQTILTVITRQPYARMLRKVRKEFCQGRTIRLTDARRFSGGASTNAFSERAVTYDRNGNILSFTRYGADTAVPEEALAYSYDGDLLSGVSNSGSSGGGGIFTHDHNGNVTCDGLSGLDIEYDDLNLTSRVSSGDTTLAEKYYAVSPYAYCIGNPISLFDPNGTDVWTVDAFGNVVWKEQSDTHCLYYVDNDGNLSEDYVTVSDRSILDDLTKTEVKTDGGAEVSSHSSKTGINDMFKVFKFASDNTKVEWVIHRNGDSYTIGTGHKTDNAASWEDYVGAMPNATVHSHPGTWQDMADEINSMGYGSAFYNTDQTHAKQEIDKYGSKARINYVYFPVSRRLYKVGYYNASFIRNIKNHKGFYFGTLNKK